MTSTTVLPSLPPLLESFKEDDRRLASAAGSAGILAILVGLGLACRFLVPWHRLCRKKRKSLDGESEKLGDLTSWVDGDVEARQTVPAASPAAQLRSLLQSTRPQDKGQAFVEEELPGNSYTAVRPGVTPAAQLRNFVPGSHDVKATMAPAQPLPVLREVASEAAEDEVLDTSVGVEAPKEAERAADGDAAVPQDPAQHIRELRSCLAMRERFRAELESRVADFVQSEELLGSIMKNEKSERQLEQRLADLAGKEGEAKAKRPYMLSVALNSLPQADYELPTLPGQCEERR